MALRKRGGNFFNLLQKEGGTQKGGVPSEKGREGMGSNPGRNYDMCVLCVCMKREQNWWKNICELKISSLSAIKY